jgi:hypothetical protein
MKPIFANPNPINYSYDSVGDVIYITFADQKVARTVELVTGWPILLVDLNDANQIGWSAMVIQHRWPSCRSCLADQRASISGGQESSGHYANIWRQETVGARRLKVYFI